MMRLIDSKLSGNAWKVRLVLRELEIPFERETLDLSKGAHKSSEFQQKNPFQRVPVLVLHDGRTLFESGAILEYLSQGTDLFPTEPIAQSEVMSWLFFEQSDLMRFLAYPRFFALTGTTEQNREIIDHYHSLARHGLDILANALSARDWVSEQGRTIADYALYPYVRLAPEGGLNTMDWAPIADWCARFEALDRYEPLVPTMSQSQEHVEVTSV